MSYSNDNDSGFGARHFDQLTTASLFSASSTLRDANDRIREFEENNKGDIRDTCMRDVQAVEAAIGPIFEWYNRENETIHCSTSMKNFAFIGQMMVLGMKVMERYCSSMANTRDIAAKLENLVNLLTHQVDEHGEPDFNIFSSLIDGGEKDSLVELISDALKDTTDTNVFNHLVEQAADMALVSTASIQHHTQREVVDMTNGNIMERVGAKMIADMEAQRARATQNASPKSGSAPVRGERPSWLRVVEGKKE